MKRIAEEVNSLIVVDSDTQIEPSISNGTNNSENGSKGLIKAF